MISRFVAAGIPQGEAIRTIEIETVNRCNGTCSFCPVNKNTDPQKAAIYDHCAFRKNHQRACPDELFRLVGSFSNNEPFLDKRLVEFHRYARQRLPSCRMHLFTNGTLLTKDKFLEIIPYLDELIINNYSDDTTIPENLNQIMDCCREDPALIAKVTVVLRRQNELLSSRGGDALNRQQLPDVGRDTCALPFQQLIIRPDGKVRPCCNDPLGKYTMGDLNHQTIAEIWGGAAFTHVRNQLKKGRNMLDKCRKCDAFHFYF